MDGDNAATDTYDDEDAAAFNSAMQRDLRRLRDGGSRKRRRGGKASPSPPMSDDDSIDEGVALFEAAKRRRCVGLCSCGVV